MTEWLCFLSWKAVQNQLLCFRRANRHIVWSYPYCSRFRPKNTRLLTLNPDIRSDQLFCFSAASGGPPLFAGVKRFLLTTISLLLKKTPNGINAYRKIQCFYNLQAGNIRLFFHKRKDTLWVCIRELWLLAAEIGLSFITPGFISAFQQAVIEQEVKTTGEAGGLIRPCKGLLPASANRAPKIWQSHLYYRQPPSSGGSFTFFSFY